MTHNEEFKPLYDSLSPQTDDWPGPWNDKLNQFQKIVALKTLRSDKLVPAVENWIIAELGAEFVKPPVFDIGKCFKDSTVMTPLIFVLSSGSDPVADFKRFADEMDMNKRIDSISLG